MAMNFFHFFFQNLLFQNLDSVCTERKLGVEKYLLSVRLDIRLALTSRVYERRKTVFFVVYIKILNLIICRRGENRQKWTIVYRN